MLVSALILIAVLVVAAVGGVLAVLLERRSPTSYTRSPGADLAWWALLSADEQEAVDEAALDVAEQADLDAKADAREAAEFLAHRAQANALFHP
jgi:hypothetical protein